MSLMPNSSNISSKFIIALLNSNLIFDYYREFLNCTVNVQINDIRLIPVIIPNKKQIIDFEALVNSAIRIKKSLLEEANANVIDNELLIVEQKIDNAVLLLYRI